MTTCCFCDPFLNPEVDFFGVLWPVFKLVVPISLMAVDVIRWRQRRRTRETQALSVYSGTSAF
jgi:hypothetical protein